jgi:demethylmenaquinone methyltransferase/2-methoxy-6-polyprenyl-1,4-benzoquinol methylase
MPASHWHEQITYYRHRAGEYDATAYGGLPDADEVIAALVDGLRPAGDVLEIACGTGMWTRHLVAHARTLTAVDSAPEMLALARCRAPDATFLMADVLDWTPPRRFDTVFFAFWLSHVPAAAFDRFWSVVRAALAEGGRVVFVDDRLTAADEETYVAGSEEIVERCLADGSHHRLVKSLRDPGELTARLAELGWRAEVANSAPDWLIGQASPARWGAVTGRADGPPRP